MRKYLAALIVAAATINVASADDEVKKLILPGESFLIEGRPAFVMTPGDLSKSARNPWILYAPTLPGLPDAAEKWMHEKFLAAGISVAGIDVGEGYGSPKANRLISAFYDEMTGKRGFAAKPCLLGRSRGGLWSVSWAGDNPEKVAGIAGIYPVFDLRTYPKIEKAAPAFELAPEQLQARLAEFNPIERVSILARARIPVFLIHGDEDVVVPIERNSAELVTRYRAGGAEEFAKLVVAKGQGHNYWEGFFQCQELIDFAIAQARLGAKQK